MSHPDWQRPGPSARQRLIDLVVGLSVIAGALLNVLLSRGAGAFVFGVHRGLAEQLAWAAAVTVPLIWRRRRPEIVMLVVAAVFIGGQMRGAQEQQFASGAIFAAIYAVGAWGRRRSRARWTRIAVIGAMFVWLAVAWLLTANRIPPGGPPGATGELPWLLSAVVNQILVNVLVFGFAYLFGETAWLAARRRHELELNAAELRAAREVAEERAVLAERVRIARDLHDVVAHHVSVMGIQAAAARRALDKDAAKSRVALAEVEQGARVAVDELHRMLGALRAPGDTPAASPAAGLERLAELADRVRAAGLRAELAVFGEPAPVDVPTSQTAYRILQESVTNVLRHARATSVDIRVRYLAHELELDVADDGHGATSRPVLGRPAAAARSDATGSPADRVGTDRAGSPHDGAGPRAAGFGLRGMHERVALLGGALEAGNRPAGGFRVRARLPLRPTTAHPVAASADGDPPRSASGVDRTARIAAEELS